MPNAWDRPSMLLGLTVLSIACFVATGEIRAEMSPAPVSHDSLVTAVAAGEVSVVARLLDEGANVNQQNPDGRTAIMIAAATSRADLIEVLARHGADVNAVDKNGDTSLKHAIKQKCYECIQTLLSHNADPNIRGDDGRTALVAAIYTERPDFIRILLSHGADPNARVKATKRYFEKQREYSAIDLLAMERGSPLMAARMVRNDDIIRILIIAGAVDDPPDAQARLRWIAEAIAGTGILEILTIPWCVVGIARFWKLLKRPTEDSVVKQKHDVYVSMFILPLIALTWALLHFKYGQETGMLLFIWPPATLMNIASLAISVVVAVFAVKLRTSDIVFNGLAGVTLAYWVLHTYLMFFGGIRESLMSAFGYVAVCVIAGIWLAVRTAQARRQLGGVKDVQ